MAACPALALSSGSACTAAEIEPSYVLRALGLSDALAAASIRIGLGRFTTAEEVDFAVETIAAVGGAGCGPARRVTNAAGRCHIRGWWVRILG